MWRGRGRGRRGRGGRSRGGGSYSSGGIGYAQHTQHKTWVRDNSNNNNKKKIIDEKDESNSITSIGTSVSNSAIAGSLKKSASGYTWKRQTHSSDITEHQRTDALAAPNNSGEAEKCNSEMAKNDNKTNQRSSSYKPAVSAVNKTNTWKRQLTEDLTRPQSDRSSNGNGDGCDDDDIGNNFSWKSSDMTAQKQIMQHGRKRKRTSTNNGPRRINLLTNSMSQDQEEAETGKDANGEVLPAILPQKTLTDFCYQDTGHRRSGRGRRGVHSGGGGRTTAAGNIGIVRVKNNPSSTPICPIFRSGQPCNNPTCKLRHDVSAEASRPICVFFQRNGMCSKGDDDCPFRHVKINWDAEVCPTFQKLGYCENSDCLLRHVDAKKKHTTSASSHAKEHAPKR